MIFTKLNYLGYHKVASWTGSTNYMVWSRLRPSSAWHLQFGTLTIAFTHLFQAATENAAVSVCITL